MHFPRLHSTLTQTLVFVCAFAFSSVQGQHRNFERGYFINPQSEIIRGYLSIEDINSPDMQVYFKANADDKDFQRIETHRIKEVVTDNQHFVKRFIDLRLKGIDIIIEEAFLEKHIAGVKSLLSYTDLNKMDYFFLESEREGLISLSKFISYDEAIAKGPEYVEMLRNNTAVVYQVGNEKYFPSPDFKKTLTKELGDCFEKVSPVAKMKYSLSDFMSVIIGYHSCKRKPFKPVTPLKKPVTLTQIQVSASWRFPRPTEFNELRWTGSVLYELSRKHSFPMLYYNGGIEYFKFGDARAISLPQMVKVKTRLKRGGFFLRAGLSLLLFLEGANKQTLTNLIGYKKHRKSPFYTRVGLGYNQPIFSNPDLFFSASWDAILISNSFSSNWNMGIGTYFR